MIFGGLRLARFNTQLVGMDKDHFIGLPIPASGLTIAAFVLTYGNEISGLDVTAAKFLPWICVTLALLMVSKVKYDTLPKINKRALKKEPWKFIFGALAIVVVAATGPTAILPLFGLFIALGILRYIGSTIKHLLHHQQKLDEEEAAQPTQIDI